MESSSREPSPTAPSLDSGPAPDSLVPKIKHVKNVNSPGLPGYPSNAGSNIGNEELHIVGENFSSSPNVPVTFTPTINTSAQIVRTTGSLQPDNKTIKVLSPATQPFGAVELYVVNVCINDSWTTYTAATATSQQQFQALSTLVVSGGSWTTDINVVSSASVTIIDKDPTNPCTLSFWQGGPGNWSPSSIVGGSVSETLNANTPQLSLQANNPGSAVVTVAVTTNGQPPLVSTAGGPDVGSNGTINVGTTGGQSGEPLR